jgi:hypothetical protein
MNVMQAATEHKSPGITAEPGRLGVKSGIDIESLHGRQHLGTVQTRHAGRIGSGY